MVLQTAPGSQRNSHCPPGQSIWQLAPSSQRIEQPLPWQVMRQLSPCSHTQVSRSLQLIVRIPALVSAASFPLSAGRGWAVSEVASRGLVASGPGDAPGSPLPISKS